MFFGSATAHFKSGLWAAQSCELWFFFQIEPKSAQIFFKHAKT